MLFLPLLTSLFWAISPYFFSIAQAKIGVNQLNVDRLIFAAIVLFFVLLLSGADYNVSIMQLIFLILSGILGLICGDYFLFSSYKKIGPRYSMLMMSLAPIFSCIGAKLIFKESIENIGIIGIIITITGIGIVIGKTNNSQNISNNNQNKTSSLDTAKHVKPSKLLFGILAAIGQALGLLCVKQAYIYGTLTGISATFFRISSAGIILIIWLIIIRKYSNPVKVYIKDRTALKYVLLGTLFGPILGITSSIISLEYVPVSIAQTLFSTSPIFMLPISHFIMKDKINIRTIIGVIIAIIGIVLLTLF